MDEFNAYMHKKYGVDIYTVYYLDEDERLIDIQSFIDEYSHYEILKLATYYGDDMNAKMFEVYLNGEYQDSYKIISERKTAFDAMEEMGIAVDQFLSTCEHEIEVLKIARTSI